MTRARRCSAPRHFEPTCLRRVPQAFTRCFTPPFERHAAQRTPSPAWLSDHAIFSRHIALLLILARAASDISRGRVAFSWRRFIVAARAIFLDDAAFSAYTRPPAQAGRRASPRCWFVEMRFLFLLAEYFYTSAPSLHATHSYGRNTEAAPYSILLPLSRVDALISCAAGHLHHRTPSASHHLHIDFLISGQGHDVESRRRLLGLRCHARYYITLLSAAGLY